MEELRNELDKILSNEPFRIIVSKPTKASNEFVKLEVLKNAKGYQISKYTSTQVFHENLGIGELGERLAALINGEFRQVNAWDDANEYMLMISKKGAVSFKKRALKADEKKNTSSAEAGKELAGANRQKNYLIKEGAEVAPLVDMGIFTKEGKVVKSMYDKFKQINRFIEIINDVIEKEKLETINVIDFGCGKSYLTFILYYYLTEVRKIKANVVGLDLKKDVINKCNAAAKKYGYEGLKFELGDINGFNPPFDVDMVITLHACDTATDYALFNAISWNAKMIFSVPCCQHELNKQIATESLGALTHYGIIKERFAALATDAIRGELLEYKGYKTQLLEFVDFDHTPKNIMIRAVKKGIVPASVSKKSLDEVKQLCDEFSFEPTLVKLLGV